MRERFPAEIQSAGTRELLEIPAPVETLVPVGTPLQMEEVETPAQQTALSRLALAERQLRLLWTPPVLEGAQELAAARIPAFPSVKHPA